MTDRRARVVSLLVSMLVLAASPSTAEDFKVESSVYHGKGEIPSIEIVTLFYNGVAYDYLSVPGEVDETTIFDAAHGRFVLLDSKRKLRSEVSTSDLRAFSEKLRKHAASQAEPVVKFLANPRFKQRPATRKGELILNSDWLDYQLQTVKAPSPEVAQRYSEFAHWHAQLNVLMEPRSLPPFGRMEVNEMLERDQLLPTEVQMTLFPKDLKRRTIVRAEHRLQWTLVESDRQRIDETGKRLASYQQVSLEQYQQRAIRQAKK